jgi:hypothetical protein
MIREEIHSVLDIHSLSLYMTFRYIADFEDKDALVKRSAKFLYEKAKISRRQFFLSLNILENFGLVLREPSNPLNSISTYHVAQDLYYFYTDCRVVHEMHGVVHGMHTDHYPLPIKDNINIISDLTEKPENPLPEIDAILQVYEEVLPDCPKIKVVDSKLKQQLHQMRKNWPKYQKEGKAFSLESFKDYLVYLKTHYGWFVQPYTTESGSIRRNSLRNFTREINICKIVNGEFSAS